ncbi:MAG: glycosyltransferase family 2 protein, partial [Deinococcus sp.]
VVDGPDPQTREALEMGSDPRVRPVYLPRNMGGSDARNEGIRLARGEWVALLDDDDEWLPEKLARQLALARQSRFEWPIVSCRWLTRTGSGDNLNPPRPPEPGEKVGDYIFTRKGSLTSSTLFAATGLLRRVPFTSGLPRHQDSDWLLRAGEVEGVGLELVPQVELIYYQDQQRNQVSWRPKWRQSLGWAEDHVRAGRLSKTAQTSFIVSYLAPMTARNRDLTAFVGVLGQLLRLGAPPAELLRYLAIWALPLPLRRVLKVALRRLGYRRLGDEGPPPPDEWAAEPTPGPSV